MDVLALLVALLPGRWDRHRHRATLSAHPARSPNRTRLGRNLTRCALRCPDRGWSPRDSPASDARMLRHPASEPGHDVRDLFVRTCGVQYVTQCWITPRRKRSSRAHSIRTP